jgi:hypothetical protein
MTNDFGPSKGRAAYNIHSVPKQLLKGGKVSLGSSGISRLELIFRMQLPKCPSPTPASSLNLEVNSSYPQGTIVTSPIE